VENATNGWQFEEGETMTEHHDVRQSRIITWTLWRVVAPLVIASLLLSMLKMARLSWLEGWQLSFVEHLQTGLIASAFISVAYEWIHHVNMTRNMVAKLVEIARGHARHVGDEPPLRPKHRTLVGVMADEFEASVARMSVVLFVGLVALVVAGFLTNDRRITSVACGVAVLVLVAHARQGLVRWRVERGYFGTSEHEVRELLLFALRHKAPDDFLDGGSMLPAFEIGERQEGAAGWVGEAGGAGATP
jgi:hypothetical protein